MRQTLRWRKAGRLAAALACIAFAQVALAQNAGNAPGEPQVPADNGQSPRDARPPAAAIQQTDDAPGRAQQRGEDLQLAGEDLGAQQAMAIAADRLVFWAKVQTWVGGSSFLLLMATIFYARRAANHSQEQVTEAKRQAAAAEDQLALAKGAYNAEAAARATQYEIERKRRVTDLNNANRQLRAYVTAIGAGLPVKGNQANRRPTVAFKNHGQTPAYDVRHAFRMEVRRFDGAFEVGPLFPSAIPGIIGPGDPITVAHPKHFDVVKMQDSLLEGENIYIFGELAFRDINNRRWILRHRHRVVGDPTQTYEIEFCQIGNEEVAQDSEYE